MDANGHTGKFHPRSGNAGTRGGLRGNALLGAMFVSAVLMAVVLTAFHSSDTTARTVVSHQSHADSLAAAEYGANRAIAEMSSWLRMDGNSGIDWVYGTAGETLYVDSLDNRALDHRRFVGTFGDQDYRVMVRNASLAKEHGTKGDKWLWEPDVGETLYEIISTARPVDITSQSSERRTSATLQTVVSVNFQNGWSNGRDFGPYYTPEPPNFQPYLSDNVILSGEDHDINKYYADEFESERIVTPLKLTSATANFMLADGGYWRSGQLTLNYRMEPAGSDANPHRPKTPDFGTSNDNRAMYVADKNREYDTYLLGGKRNSTSNGQGKTVTVNMNSSYGGIDGIINETANAQTSEGGAFNLVLGQFEDLRNLYINMAGVVGNFTDPNNWWQMYVGQYTHKARASSYTSSSLKSYPNYGGTRIRAQTAHLMKNKDGQVLVRLFKHSSNGKLYKYPASSTVWTGYYCWADVDITKSAGVFLTKNVTATTTIPGESKNAQTVARTFFWQELVGYQLVRRNERPAQSGDEDYSSYPNEPAIVTQRDLPIGGGQKIDKRTIYRVDGDGNRLPAGFDEIYQAHKDAGVSGNTTDSKHPLYGDKYTTVSPGYLQDRFDAIYVWEDGLIVKKAEMNDFLFEKDFGNDADGNPIVRQALALHIGYEDQRESTADFDYCDMVFTIYISPSTPRVVKPAVMFTLLTDQWWEQNPDNGLTGQSSHPALVTNSADGADKSGDSYKFNFDLLAYTPKSDPGPPPVIGNEGQIFTMRRGDLEYTFLRAKFETNTGNGVLTFVPAEDEDGIILSGPDHPYFWTEDDLNNYLIHEWNRNVKDTVVLAMEGDRETAKNEFLATIPSQYVMQEMPKRWDLSDVTKPVLSDDATNTSYSIMRTAQFIREIGAEIFGFLYQNVPAVDTYEYQPVSYGGGEYAEPAPTSLGYLAGEMVQDASQDELSPVPDEYVPFRADRETKQPDGSITPTREFITANPVDAVAMAYQDYYDGNETEKEAMQAIYGVKDKRYSIGFHRSGPSNDYAPRFSQDHYEVVLMGQLGFNPYKETTDGLYVSRNSDIDPNGPDAPPYHRYEFKSGAADMVPDFVFDKLIDGCGILLINGNLVVKDEFAYYGLLIVTGDLIIRPTYRPDRFIYGGDGNPVDAYGNSLYRNSSNVWVYVWEDPNDPDNVRETDYVLDDSGKRMKDLNGDEIPVEPLYATGADAYRGRLITQGNLLVGGKVVTERVENQFSPGEYISGKLHCYANQTANDLTNSLSDIEKNVTEVVSWSSSTNAVLEQDAQKLWSGEK